MFRISDVYWILIILYWIIQIDFMLIYYNNLNLLSITQYKINWRKHIQIIDDNRLPKKKNLNYEPEGRRNLG